MSTTGGLNQRVIENLAQENRNKLYEDLEKEWQKIIEESNEIISKIESNNNFINQNYKKVYEILNRISNDLDYYLELGINPDEMGYLRRDLHLLRIKIEKNYRILSMMYYDYMANHFNDTTDRVNELMNHQSKIEKSINALYNRIQSLGGTFLNIVLTISIVSTMVTILTKVSSQYSITIVLVCAWLLLSSIIFISNFFKNPLLKGNDNFTRITYCAISIITLASLLIPIIHPMIYKSICDKVTKDVYIVNNNTTKYNIVEDKELIDNFINDFSLYWQENDFNYLKYKDILYKDNINSILFYKYLKNNIEIIDYELLLANGDSITLKIDNSLLIEWNKKNNII